MNKAKLGLISALAALSPLVQAGNPTTPISEPSVLPLMLIGGIAIYLLKKKK